MKHLNMHKNLKGIPKKIFDANIRSALLYHTVHGRVLSNDMSNDQMLMTLLDSQTLRINRYSSNIFTVNCKSIIRKDQKATNGVIHLIDDVLTPSKTWPLLPLPQTLIDDGRFRDLSRLFLQSDLYNELGHSKTIPSYTLFAPYDEAFHKLTSNQRARYEQSNARKDLLKHHIIPHTVCPIAITGEHTMVIYDGNNEKLLCNRTGTFINGAKLTGETIITDNGIINIVDEVLIPESVKSLYELIEMRTDKLSSFKSSLDQCPELVHLLRDSSQSLSLFAPNNEAFAQLSSHQIGNILDNCRLFVKSHIIPIRLKTNIMTDNQRLNTLSPSHSITCKVTRQGMGVDDAMIQDPDIEGINGILHIVDEVLIMP